ncbi:DUF6197 family protein [Streptomyces sp. S1]|uniref:DUF6197 family protein n=1 Tax=Streptomyces sp. S1 TaxID=718288 RepID=UPI003D752D34
MPEIDKAAVYRKAAEIIVRDGKTEGDLVEAPQGVSEPEALMDPSRPVCALGACARAQYELYGLLPKEPYDYEFKVPRPSTLVPAGVYMRKIQYFNDDDHATAEDIAVLLKQRAEEVDGG